MTKIPGQSFLNLEGYRPDLMLDSGAFSAWKLKKDVDINAYILAIKRIQDRLGEQLSSYINLDVIIPHDTEKAAEAGHENFNAMRKAGLDPMPVFHAGEDIKWLDRMVADGAPYIGLSASSITSAQESIKWYDAVWPRLVNDLGLPIVKVHAFGEGREAMIRRYPWYSADSSTWVLQATKFGVAHIHVNGKRVRVANGYNGKSYGDARHLDEISGEDIALIRQEVSEMGLDWDLCAEKSNVGYLLRTFLSAHYFCTMQKRCRSDTPKTFRSQGFFLPSQSKGKGIEIFESKVYLAIMPNCLFALPALRARSQNMLCSYFYMRTQGSYEHMLELIEDPVKYATRPECVKRIEQAQGIRK